MFPDKHINQYILRNASNLNNKDKMLYTLTFISMLGCAISALIVLGIMLFSPSDFQKQTSTFGIFFILVTLSGTCRLILCKLEAKNNLLQAGDIERQQTLS